MVVRDYIVIMRTKLLKKLQADLKRYSRYRLAKMLGMDYSTLHRILSGKSPGSLNTWEKVEKFYGVK
jgi:transcriptional regulator with XRE-family HTH domain